MKSKRRMLRDKHLATTLHLLVGISYILAIIPQFNLIVKMVFITIGTFGLFLSMPLIDSLTANKSVFTKLRASILIASFVGLIAMAKFAWLFF